MGYLATLDRGLKRFGILEIKLAQAAAARG